MTSASVAMGRNASQSDACQALRMSRSVSRMTAALEESDRTDGLRACCSRILFDGIRPGIGLAGKEPRHVPLLEAANAVAELGGTFEFEFLGGFAHLLLELLEQFSKLLFVLDSGSRGVKGLVVQGHGNIVGFDDAGELHVHGLYNGHWRDVVLFIESHLLGAAAIGFVDGLIHGVSAAVGIENGAAFDMAGAAADGLNQRSGAAEIAFLVGVENGDKRDFGQVQPFAKQVDADEHVKFTAAQIAKNLDAVERFDFRVQIAAADTDLSEIFRQVFGHTLGQSGDQHALTFLRAKANLLKQVVHLALHGANFHFGIHEASGANDLLDDNSARACEFVGTRRRGHIHDLVHAVLEFLEGERAIIEGGGHAEAVVHQRLFAGAVTVKHAAHLGNGLVRFVNEKQIVLGDVVEKSRRSFAGQTATEMPGIIFDAVTVANGAHHFNIKKRALHDALGFDKFSLLLEFLFPPLELFLNADDSAVALVLRHDVMGFRVDGNAGQVFVARTNFAGERIDLPKSVNLISPHFDAIALIFVGGVNLDHVAANAESAATQVFAALVLNVHETAEERLSRSLVALFQHDQHSVIGFGRAETVDAGNGGDDDDVAALEE